MGRLLVNVDISNGCAPSSPRPIAPPRCAKKSYFWVTIGDTARKRADRWPLTLSPCARSMKTGAMFIPRSKAIARANYEFAFADLRITSR